MKAISMLASALPLLAQVTDAAPVDEVKEAVTTLRNGLRRLGMQKWDLSTDAGSAMDDPENNDINFAQFDQLLDHKDESKGTFKQRYWWNSQFYKPGGPIFLFSPGESTADQLLGYLENTTLPGLYAQEFSGAALILEHRYFGKSIPFDELTAETMQYFNVPNAIADQVHFAETVDMPFCKGECTVADSPWVLIGGSYSGALTAWTQQLSPGTFTAYHASSAVVEAIYDFWEYFSPIEAALEAISKACANDVKTVVSYIDGVLQSKNKNDITTLKTRFGLSALNDGDFAAAVASPVWAWQNDQSQVVKFCSTMEAASQNYTRYMWQESGVGLVTALNAYASYIKDNAGCGPDGSACDTSNVDWNTPKSLTDDRAWDWLLCNEPFGWWQVGPPDNTDGQAIVSSALRPEYFQSQCPLKFPKTNGFQAGSVQGFTEDHFNMYTGGWDAPFEKVIFVQGEFDPWRSATIGSDYRPGGPVESSDTIPNLVVTGGVHVPELVLDPPSAHQQPVVDEAMKYMGQWLGEWEKPSKKA